MSSVRVCAITYDYYPFDVLVRRTAEAAASAGYMSHVICLRDEGQTAYEECNGVQIYRISMRRAFGGSLPATIWAWIVFMILAAVKVTRLHAKHKYTVIHVHNMPDFLVFSALVPKLGGVSTILEVQDVSPELMAAKAKGRARRIILRLATWQEQISAAFATHVVTVGWPFEELLLKRGIPARKLTSVLNSADPRLFPVARRTEPTTEPPSAEHPLILMYHGTVSERNGLETAIRALAKARQKAPYLRLDIKGRGEVLPYLKQLAQELGVRDYVVFTDPCPSDELVDFVIHGDIGIIPYRSDGFMDLVLPTKAYEFAWMHRPIIASDTPAIRSMFRPESLLLCEPSNADSFADAIVDLYQHREKRTQLIANAEQDYMPYRWELMAERYQQLLALLAKKSRKNA
jgi:glycosyltransferase involved in cell wall biosynthesis